MRGHVPSRLRLRRRLLVFSAPVVLIALITAVKMLSVVVAGSSAGENFERRDIGGLRADVATLSVLNVIQRAKAPFAAGALAVVEERLDEADTQFSQSLSLTEDAQSCPVRVNLELVRERQGDVHAWQGRPDQARERYRSALGVVADAPQGCFEDNTDPDPERRAVRQDAAARLAAKMDGLTAPPPPAPSPPPAPAAPPPPPPVAPAAPELEAPREPLRLDPGAGDPLERLQQVLEDAAG